MLITFSKDETKKNMKQTYFQFVCLDPGHLALSICPISKKIKKRTLIMFLEGKTKKNETNLPNLVRLF